MSELVVSGLEKGFGASRVLRGLDLTVAPGSLCAVLGPSGCGKTTLLRVVAGFEMAEHGTVTIDGRTVSGPGVSVPTERRRVGVVPQEGALFPHLPVAGNVGFGLSRSARRRGRVEELLELVGLAGFGARMPVELSGGQQQRVALARALAPDPALVLLDEPFSSLDTGLRAALREDVRAALRTTGATAVLVTHDQQEALSIADTVAVMRDGVMVQVAPPSELYSAPGDVGVATFVGEAVVLPAVLRGGRAHTVLGDLPIRGGATGESGTVVIRPEQVVLELSGAGVPARVRATVYYGHDALVQLELADRSAGGRLVSARSSGRDVVPDGTVVGLRVAGDVSFFACGEGPEHPAHAVTTGVADFRP